MYKLSRNDINTLCNAGFLELNDEEFPVETFGFNITKWPGGKGNSRDRTFEKDCLQHKALPILCCGCKNADVINFNCKIEENKINKIKFDELQDFEHCEDFK
jgi:hypothetical protein